MEVIPINTNDNVTSKADLWADRFHAFQESGLSRKEWCQQNGIPQSTLGYWIESSSQKQLRQKVLLIRCLQSSLRNMNSISVQQVQENLL